MDDGPWLYYKLTNEPKGSGELIITAIFRVSEFQDFYGNWWKQIVLPAITVLIHSYRSDIAEVLQIDEKKHS